MKSVRCSLCLVFSIAVVGFVVLANVASSDPGGKSVAEKTYISCYDVADLPVLRGTANGSSEFDASILIALIKSTVSPDSWNDNITIRSFSENKSIVVSQTQPNHEAIAQLLASFRPTVRY